MHHVHLYFSLFVSSNPSTDPGDMITSAPGIIINFTNTPSTLKKIILMFFGTSPSKSFLLEPEDWLFLWVIPGL